MQIIDIDNGRIDIRNLGDIPSSPSSGVLRLFPYKDNLFTIDSSGNIKSVSNRGARHMTTSSIQNLGAAASSLSISVPSSDLQYSLLRIKIKFAANSANTELQLRLNNDSSASNYFSCVDTRGTSTFFNNNSSGTVADILGFGNTAGAVQFGTGYYTVVDGWLFNYNRDDVEKRFFWRGTLKWTGFRTILGGGCWTDTAAVTSLDFVTSTDQFSTDTRWNIWVE